MTGKQQALEEIAKLLGVKFAASIEDNKRLAAERNLVKAEQDRVEAENNAVLRQYRNK